MSDKKKRLILFLTTILFIILIALLIVLAINTKKEPQENQQQEEQVTPISKEQLEGDLDLSFLKLENTEKNKIYSPLSIKYALKMVEEGADGNTKLQIQNLTRNIDLTKYSSINNVISLANCIYIRDTYKKYVKTEFKNALINKYNAEINYDSFTNANNINKWIEDKTLGIIKNMLDDSLVQNRNTEMLLINALAIDMEWQSEFNGSDTKEREFILPNGSKSKVSMMHKETSSPDVSYYKDQNITVLTMDLQKYDNTQLEFTAIMPNSNLKEYVGKFSLADLDKIYNSITLASNTKDGVSIYIPRFSFEYDLGLKKDLQALGINDAFDQVNANFTNITTDPAGLYVSEALHKAHIDFTEKGVKAAAVTAFTFAVRSSIVTDKKEPIEIKIDKPFLFIIRDKLTEEIWFVGTVYEPELWKDTPKDNGR